MHDWQLRQYWLNPHFLFVFSQVCGLSGAKTACRRWQRDVSGVWRSCTEIFNCRAIRKWHQICELLHQMCESEWNRLHNQGLSFRLIKPHVIFFFIILSNRQVFILTLWRCTVTSSVRVSAPGLLPSMWPGHNSLSRGDWMNRLMPCTRKPWRTKPSQPTLLPMN